jgi:hypothetical protein
MACSARHAKRDNGRSGSAPGACPCESPELGAHRLAERAISAKPRVTSAAALWPRPTSTMPAMAGVHRAAQGDASTSWVQ